MLGLGKHKQVAEYEAEGEIDRVYYELGFYQFTAAGSSWNSLSGLGC